MPRRNSLGDHLQYFLMDYLPRQRNASPHTVHAYRDSLKLLLIHVADVRKTNVADLSLEHIDRDVVLSFLEAIEKKRGNGPTTRNLRLTAIRSFFRAVAQDAPEHIQQAQRLLSIPQKRTTTRVLDYLTVPEVEAILKQPSPRTWAGRRDNALLRFLYNTGARVQEALNVCAKDIRVEQPSHVLILGKGRKERLCPLWPQTVDAVQRTLRDRGDDGDGAARLFTNRQGVPLTRYGVRYILAKYVLLASHGCPSLRGKNIHPHTTRHTTAMHLLQSGVDLNTIRCWLGHVDLATTNRYVEVDLEMKRRALGEVPVPHGRRPALVSRSLLTWLEAI
jgi:site-specific recombinase XerD